MVTSDSRAPLSRLETPFGLDELELIGDHMFVIGVPRRFPAAFKKYVFAAAKTYLSGNKSVDYMLRRYGDHWSFDEDVLDERTRLFQELANTIRSVVGDEERRFSRIKDKPDHLGLFAAGAALLRLQQSFRASILMATLGTRFEASCINKLILEQLAWGYAVRPLTDDRVFQVSPTKAVSELKRLVPLAGRLYGVLNRDAHIVAEQTKDYVLFEDDGPKVVLSSPDYSLVSLFYLLLLADMYVAVSEYVNGELYNSLQHVQRDSSGHLTLNPGRHLAAVIEERRRAMLELLRRSGNGGHHAG